MRVIDVAPLVAPASGEDAIDAAEKALAVAEARGHAHQLRQWTVLPVELNKAAVRADDHDRVRPATVPTYFAKGKVLNPGDDDYNDRRNYDLTNASPPVSARLMFGRHARQKFYEGECGKKLHPALRGDKPELSFAQSFQHIVADPSDKVELSVESKIAVVYADGNKFGEAREDAGVANFSTQLDLLRKNLLKAVTDWLAQGALNKDWQDIFAVTENRNGRELKGLRFETILYGGDELAFVMPAWLATAFVEGFFRHTAGWEIETKGAPVPLSHAVGVAIAHYKVPIRQLRSIAKKAADAAKDAGLRETNSATFEIFESLHPPDEDLARWRYSVFGGGQEKHTDDFDKNLALRLALPGDGDAFSKVLDKLELIVWGSEKKNIPAFPRSQLYAVLRELRNERLGVADADKADKLVTEKIETYAGRAGGDRGLGLSDLTLPALIRPRGAAMDVALIATLWDYANPFEIDKSGLPRFPGLRGPA
jgi:hypothetical protein